LSYTTEWETAGKQQKDNINASLSGRTAGNYFFRPITLKSNEPQTAPQLIQLLGLFTSC
jgi:hypothetical protein